MPGTNFFVKKRNKIIIKFLIGVTIFFIIILFLNYFSPFIRNSFFYFSSPIQQKFWNAGIATSSIFNSFLKGGFYAKENEILKSENQKLLSQLSLMQSIINGNEALSEVSMACQNDQFNLKMVSIIGLNNEDLLTINKGIDDGIDIGMPVISQQKALVGIVSKSYKNFSEVTLISNKNSVINVKTLQEDPLKPEVNGIIRGKGEMEIFLDLVLIDDNISPQETIVTSGLDGSFPKNLLIGKIIKVEKNDKEPHQKAQVQPFFNISSDNLFVITNYKR